MKNFFTLLLGVLFFTNSQGALIDTIRKKFCTEGSYKKGHLYDYLSYDMYIEKENYIYIEDENYISFKEAVEKKIKEEIEKKFSEDIKNYSENERDNNYYTLDTKPHITITKKAQISEKGKSQKKIEKEKKDLITDENIALTKFIKDFFNDNEEITVKSIKSENFYFLVIFGFNIFKDKVEEKAHISIFKKENKGEEIGKIRENSEYYENFIKESFEKNKCYDSIKDNFFSMIADETLEEVFRNIEIKLSQNHFLLEEKITSFNYEEKNLKKNENNIKKITDSLNILNDFKSFFSEYGDIDEIQKAFSDKRLNKTVEYIEKIKELLECLEEDLKKLKENEKKIKQEERKNKEAKPPFTEGDWDSVMKKLQEANESINSQKIKKETKILTKKKSK